MPNSTVVKNFRDGLVTFKDATGTPIVAPEKYSNGDFSTAGLAKRLNNVAAYESRGELNVLRHTTRTYPTGSFSIQFAENTSATATSLLDAVLKAGAFASAVSTSGANADVYTLTITFVVEGTTYGDSADHTATYTNCYITADFAEGDPDTLTFNWTCYGTVTLA